MNTRVVGFVEKRSRLAEPCHNFSFLIFLWFQKVKICPVSIYNMYMYIQAHSLHFYISYHLHGHQLLRAESPLWCQRQHLVWTASVYVGRSMFGSQCKVLVDKLLFLMRHICIVEVSLCVKWSIKMYSKESGAGLLLIAFSGTFHLYMQSVDRMHFW